MLVFGFEYRLRVRSYCIASVFISCSICYILQTVIVTAVSGDELKGNKGELKGSKICNYQVVDDDWMSPDQKCETNEISLDAQCERNKQRLQYLLNISVTEINLKKEQQVIGCIPGDVMVAVLFPVHKLFYADKESSHFLKCGSRINFDGVLAIERVWHIIKWLKPLRGYKIGAYIIDDCDSEMVAQYQILKLLEYTYLSTNNSYFEGSCLSNKNEVAPLIGVFEVSTETRFTNVIYPLLNALKIPYIRQVDLPTSKPNFEEQLRDPSWDTFTDTFILFDILNHFNWTYVSLIYAEDYYDLNQFGTLANYYNVCVAKSEVVYNNRHDTYYQSLVTKLNATDKVKVIVSFIRDSQAMVKLLRAMDAVMEEVENFILLSSAEWLPPDYEFFEYISRRSKLPQILIFRRKPEFNFGEGFNSSDVYHVLDDMSVRNPWLKDIVLRKHNCTTFDIDDDSIRSGKSCVGKTFPLNDVSTLKGFNYFLNMITNLNILYGLLSYTLSMICNDIVNCTRPSITFMRHIDNYRRLDWVCTLDEIGTKTVTFDRLSKQVKPHFEILNHQKVDNKSHFIIAVRGQWNYTTHRMELEVIDALGNMANKLNLIQSKCSDLCSPSQKKIIPNPATPCCWVCVNACPKQRMIFNVNNTIGTNASCVLCMENEWPNEDLTRCERLPVIKLKWDDPEMLIPLIYSVLVISLAMMSFTVFLKHRNTPVVKSSTKELSFTMLIAIIVINCLVFVNMAECTVFTCSIQRILLSSCFATMYAALLVKTTRIARLLALSKGQFPKLKMRFMSIKSQIIFTITLIIFQLIVVCIGLNSRPTKRSPSYKYCSGPKPSSIRYVCWMDEITWLFDYLFLSILILLCTACAVWTRNVPDNFNEAKYIGFSMYSTCITWLGFWLIYFNTEYKVITLCLCSSTNSLIMLIFLFFPKLYVIIWKPEKNNKRFFTPSEGIRRHIGGNCQTGRVSGESLTTS